MNNKALVQICTQYFVIKMSLRGAHPRDEAIFCDEEIATPPKNGGSQ